MKHKRKGFTLIEIMLFLAITWLLFVGIIVGTNNSIAQQRFNDSVQNFVELLRSVYSEVSNPQSVGDGRADVAIYGKLIVFGQRYGLDGARISDELEQRIYVYDVVGNADNAGNGSVANVLSQLGANVVVVAEKDELGNIVRMEPAGEVRSYTMRWGASLETALPRDVLNPVNNLFKGSILIVRHPQSGTINTLFSKTVINVNDVLNRANNRQNFGAAKTLLGSWLNKKYKDGGFEDREVDFCINPGGAEKDSEIRRNVRLDKNTRNVSGIEVIDLDLNEVVDGEQIGNKCRFF